MTNSYIYGFTVPKHFGYSKINFQGSLELTFDETDNLASEIFKHLRESAVTDVKLAYKDCKALPEDILFSFISLVHSR
jgi:hypothetical protein